MAVIVAVVEVAQVEVKNVMMKRILLIILFCFAFKVNAQNNLNLEFVGLTIHPAGDPTAHLQPNKLDENARFVINYGAVLTYEHFIIGDVLALKGLQSVFADCSAGWAAISHIAIKGMVLRRPKHRLGISLGPAFMIRESWRRFEDYESSGYLNDMYSPIFGPVQYKFFPVAAEIEYDLKLNEQLDFTFSVVPGVPMAFTFGFGIKYWFNRDFKHRIYLPKIKKE